MRKHLVISIAALSLLTAIACGGGEPATTGASGAGAGGAGAEMIDPATIADPAAITGSIQFAGDPPQAAAIQMAADPFCLTLHEGETVHAQRVTVNDNGTLRYVFVYVKEGLEGKRFPVPGDTVVFDQHECMYEPHVMGVRVGQTLIIRNSDETLHNVNFQPVNNPTFNRGQPFAGMEEEVVMENTEVMIGVQCDVHPWMSAFIGVLEHPYFSITGEDGSYSIGSLPAGDYVVEAWTEAFGTQTQNVTVGPNETAEISFTFGG